VAKKAGHDSKPPDTATDRASFAASEFQQDSPVLLKGVRAGRFEATFSLRRNVTSANGCSLRFIFNADDQDGYNYVELFHHDSAQAPDGYKVVDGTKRQMVSGTQTSGNMPSLGQSDVLWVRVTSDGTNLKVMMQQSASEPGSWTEGSHKVFDSANFGLAGGLIGFAGGAEAMTADDLTVKADIAAARAAAESRGRCGRTGNLNHVLCPSSVPVFERF
jgi:hypothetical protein